MENPEKELKKHLIFKWIYISVPPLTSVKHTLKGARQYNTTVTVKSVEMGTSTSRSEDFNTCLPDATVGDSYQLYVICYTKKY